MIRYIKQWYQKRFVNNEPAIFLLLSGLVVLTITFFGHLIAPVLAGLVIAFLLDIIVVFLTRYLCLKRWASVYLVFTCFLALVILAVIFIFPIIFRQLGQFLQNVPDLFETFKNNLYYLSEQYPSIFPSEQMHEFVRTISTVQLDRISDVGQSLLRWSLNSIPMFISWLVYIFLVPLVVFFLLKDKDSMITWVKQTFMPNENGALIEVWQEVKPQLGNYVKGKVIEFFIVAALSYVAFIYFNMNYALLLSVLVGASVFIPYIGMIVVTVPVVLIAVGQFGFSGEFIWVVGSYFVIQFFDGNILFPILFSEAVNIHPIAVIMAILVFGGFWGFWGLFFAVPLATLIKAGLNMWVRHKQIKGQQESANNQSIQGV